jgi:hypothetical protein
MIEEGVMSESAEDLNFNDPVAVVGWAKGKTSKQVVERLRGLGPQDASSMLNCLYGSYKVPWRGPELDGKFLDDVVTQAGGTQLLLGIAQSDFSSGEMTADRVMGAWATRHNSQEEITGLYTGLVTQHGPDIAARFFLILDNFAPDKAVAVLGGMNSAKATEMLHAIEAWPEDDRPDDMTRFWNAFVVEGD